MLLNYEHCCFFLLKFDFTSITQRILNYFLLRLSRFSFIFTSVGIFQHKAFQFSPLSPAPALTLCISRLLPPICVSRHHRSCLSFQFKVPSHENRCRRALSCLSIFWYSFLEFAIFELRLRNFRNSIFCVFCPLKTFLCSSIAKGLKSTYE